MAYTAGMAKKKAAKKVSASASESVPFEQSLSRLHEIVADLEGGEISLEESLVRYEEGMTLIRGCHEQLTTAEQKIQQLAGVDENGEATLEPFDGAATTDTVEGAGRRGASSLFE